MSIFVFLTGFYRMDIDQSARRQARDEFQVIDPDYYDMEGMLTNDFKQQLDS